MVACFTLSVQAWAQCDPSGVQGTYEFLDPAPTASDCSVSSVTQYNIWSNEAYVVTGVVAGDTYVVESCNATAWDLGIAVYNPSGDLMGYDDGVDSGCGMGASVSFEADEAGDYTIAVGTPDCENNDIENGTVQIWNNTDGGPCPVVEEITCEAATAGTAVITGPASVCFNGLASFAVEGALAPTDGDSGFTWIVTTEDVAGNTSFNTEDYYLGSFGITNNAPEDGVSTSLFNDDAALASGNTFYFTAVSFGNADMAGDTEGDLTVWTFDPDCTFISNSIEIELSDEVCSCADATAGVAAGSTEFCLGDTTDLTISGAIVPTVGDLYGFAWLVTGEDVSGSADPFSVATYFGNFAPTVGAPTTPLNFINDGSQLPAGDYYVTPVVFGNATDPSGGTAAFGDWEFDPECFVVGDSFLWTFTSIPCGDPVECADASAGDVSAVSDIVCFGESTEIYVEDALAPTSEDGAFGFVWVLSSDDLGGSVSPNTEESYFGSFGVQGTAPAGDTPLSFANDGAVPAGTYYYTAIAFGNATADESDPTNFNLMELDPDCTFTSNSIAVTFLVDGDPLCAGDCAVVDVTTTDCADDEFFIQVNVSFFGALTSMDIDDGTDVQTLTSIGTADFGPYPSGTEVTITVSTGDPECDSNGIYSVNCAPACNIVSEPGFENGPASAWTEFEDPDQPDFPIVDNSSGVYSGGAYSAWMGGYTGPQVTAISQDITFPDSGSAEGTFNIVVGACAAEEDLFTVSIDGVEMFSLDGASELCGELEFSNFTFDASQFADGGTHAVEIRLDQVAGDSPTNIWIDDFFINSCTCPADAGSLTAPAQTGSNAAVFGSDYFDGDGYSYVYILTENDADFTIVDVNETGLFDISAVADGEYVFHGLSFQGTIDDLAGLTTGAEALALIESEAICGALVSSSAVSISGGQLGVGIEEAYNEGRFSIQNVAPVPADNNLTLTYEFAGVANVQASIYDVAGRMITTQNAVAAEGLNTLTFNVADLASGMYMITLTDGSAAVRTKFVKR